MGGGGGVWVRGVCGDGCVGWGGGRMTCRARDWIGLGRLRAICTFAADCQDC